MVPSLEDCCKDESKTRVQQFSGGLAPGSALYKTALFIVISISVSELRGKKRTGRWMKEQRWNWRWGPGERGY